MKELIEKMKKRVLKEWNVYDRTNVQMDSHEEATRLSSILLPVILAEIKAHPDRFIKICTCLSHIVENSCHRFEGWKSCPKCNGTGLIAVERK